MVAPRSNPWRCCWVRCLVSCLLSVSLFAHLCPWACRPCALVRATVHDLLVVSVMLKVAKVQSWVRAKAKHCALPRRTWQPFASAVRSPGRTGNFLSLTAGTCCTSKLVPSWRRNGSASAGSPVVPPGRACCPSGDAEVLRLQLRLSSLA